MGMNKHIVGFRPPDKRWKEMKKVYDACAEAGVEIPDEVDEFFEGEEPDERGVEVDIEETDAVSEYNADMQDGFEVDITKLPKGVKIVRFYNSY